MVTINVTNNTKDTLQKIKEENKLKSIDEVIQLLISIGVNEKFSFKKEECAFELGNTRVTFTDLKNSGKGRIWECENSNLSATLLFKDEYGAFIRFLDGYDEVDCRYFHFLP